VSVNAGVFVWQFHNVISIRHQKERREPSGKSAIDGDVGGKAPPHQYWETFSWPISQIIKFSIESIWNHLTGRSPGARWTTEILLTSRQAEKINVHGVSCSPVSELRLDIKLSPSDILWNFNAVSWGSKSAFEERECSRFRRKPRHDLRKNSWHTRWAAMVYASTSE